MKGKTPKHHNFDVFLIVLDIGQPPKLLKIIGFWLRGAFGRVLGNPCQYCAQGSKIACQTQLYHFSVARKTCHNFNFGDVGGVDSQRYYRHGLPEVKLCGLIEKPGHLNQCTWFSGQPHFNHNLWVASKL